ncbi:hypothetical protein CALCODRAFT_345077 [Calocera cornea HHB12733]|uniref:Uncharacterized protein n=1 Tax=Calocera cornea HHB12733 TaxID=1353952 RepID=A0A165EUQ1_9BASI|nr:hypothetical protein CALCODRAFT_345077 [Calocera cornea HHB12733]
MPRTRSYPLTSAIRASHVRAIELPPKAHCLMHGTAETRHRSSPAHVTEADVARSRESNAPRRAESRQGSVVFRVWLVWRTGLNVDGCRRPPVAMAGTYRSTDGSSPIPGPRSRALSQCPATAGLCLHGFRVGGMGLSRAPNFTCGR